MTVAVLLISLGGCASPNSPQIDLIQGEQFGVAPDDKPKSDKYIWFSEDGWEKMVNIKVKGIKKQIAP